MRTMSIETVTLAGLAIGSDAILMQEAHGQRALANAVKTELPTDISSEDRVLLVKMGVVFGESVPKDPIFQVATLPDGWSIKPANHSMWSNLVDARGAKRAGIFYKAAFYDRSAHLRVESRYVIDVDYPRDSNEEPKNAKITDAETGEVIFTTDAYRRGICHEWLDQNRPDHKVNKGWTITDPTS